MVGSMSVSWRFWCLVTYRLTVSLEVVLHACDEVSVVRLHAHLPELIIVGAVALVDASLTQTRRKQSAATLHAAENKVQSRPAPSRSAHAKQTRMRHAL